jgi:hypothetical protein
MFSSLLASGRFSETPNQTPNLSSTLTSQSRTCTKTLGVSEISLTRFARSLGLNLRSEEVGR